MLAALAGVGWPYRAVPAQPPYDRYVPPPPHLGSPHHPYHRLPIPPPRHETRPPPPLHDAERWRWRSGHWAWRGGSWAWMPGRWYR
ncbi:MAG: hypothetical protein ACJ8AW_25500 [Rhodopila sp.]